MVEVASAYITLMPSMKGFKRAVESELRGMGEIGGKGGEEYSRGFASKARSSLGKWAKRGLVATGVAIGAGIGSAIAGGMNRMMNIEDAEAKLKGLGHTGENISAIMDDALKAVKGTSYGLDEAATSAASAVAAGVKPGEELAGYLTLVGDASTIAGVGFDEMGAIFNKVMASNRMSTEEMNQLMDKGIPVLQMVQDEYGVTADEARKMVTEGAVDFAAFESMMNESLGGAAQESGNTTRGALRNLGAAWSRFGVTLIEGVFPLVKEGIQALTGFADSMSEKVGPAVEWVGDKIGPVAETIRNGLVDGFNLAKDAGSALYDLLVGGDFTAAFRDVFGVEEDSGFVTLLFDIRENAIAAFDYMRNTAIPAVQNFFDEFRNGEGTGGKFRDALEGIRDALLDVGEYILYDVLPAARDLGAWMLEHKGVVLGVVGAYGALRVAMAAHAAAQAVAMAGGMVAWLKAYASQLAIVKAAKAAWAAITWVATGAMKALNLVLKMNPIGLVILAVTALIGAFVLLYKNNEAFRELVDRVWNWVKDTIVGVWQNHIQPVFAAIWTWIQDTLIPAFVNFYQGVIVPVWQGIWGAIKAAWDFIAPIFMAIASFVVDVLVAYFRLLMKVAEIVWKTIWAIIKGAWENWILPVFTALWGWIKDTLIPWFGYLWDKVKEVWDAVKSKISDVWEKYVKPVFQALWDWIEKNLVPVFQSLWDKVKSVWDSIKDKIKSTWDNHISPAFDSIKSGVDAVKSAFETAKDGIGTAWNKLKQIVAAPIVAVINFVNDGIIAGLNKVLNWAGVDPINPINTPASLRNAANGWFNDTALARTSGRTGQTMAATGGILPGYSPGYDNMMFYGADGSTLGLSGGEAIMRPEWTRAVGPNFIEQMNAAARSGGVNGVREAMGFADGGIWAGARNWVGERWQDVKGFVNSLKSFLGDPGGWLKAQFGGITGPFSGAISGFIGKMVGKAKDKLLGYFGGDGSTNGSVNYGGKFGWHPTGMPWYNIWERIQAVAPEARKTSDYRPGAITNSGITSLHSLGRAVDIVSSNMRATFEKIRPLMKWSQLFYTPMGGRQIGYRDAIVARDHWDHIHAALAKGGIMPNLYDNGGWLQPGVSLVSNKTGKPEAVFTDEQLQQFGGDTNITLYGIPMDAAGETADEILYQMRRVRHGKYAHKR